MEQIEENNIERIEQTEHEKMNELMKMMKEIKLKILDIEKQIKRIVIDELRRKINTIIKTPTLTNKGNLYVTFVENKDT
jgi:GTPase